MRCILPVLAALVLVGACDGRTAPDVRAPVSDGDPTDLATPQGAEAAEPEVSLEPFRRESDAVSISARYDPAILAFDPALAAYVQGSTLSVLADFEGTAQNDHASAEIDLPAYFMSIDWKLTWHGERLASLTRSMAYFSGGAHPNSATATLLWDAETEMPLGPEVLFGSVEAAQAILLEPIETALLEAKMQRMEAPETEADAIRADISEAMSGYEVLPTIGFVGVPGATPVIRAYFSPYEVGPYAEGAYELDLTELDYTDALVAPWDEEFTP